jgi:toxin ParE1/3/4
MKAEWSRQAIDDVDRLQEHISEDDPAAAERVALRILHNVNVLLANSPEMGRPGRVPGTRELVIPGTPYIVPYRVKDGVIQVVRVYHSARRWPEQF